MDSNHGGMEHVRMGATYPVQCAHAECVKFACDDQGMHVRAWQRPRDVRSLSDPQESRACV